jgi:hypothetical protein
MQQLSARCPHLQTTDEELLSASSVLQPGPSPTTGITKRNSRFNQASSEAAAPGPHAGGG